MEKQTSENTLDNLLSQYELNAYFQERKELQTQENIEIIDERFDDLAKYIGRELTEEEQSALLDIVDEHTPKNSQGNYAIDLFPFEYAWRIYETKRNSQWEQLSRSLFSD